VKVASIEPVAPAPSGSEPPPEPDTGPPEPGGIPSPESQPVTPTPAPAPAPVPKPVEKPKPPAPPPGETPCTEDPTKPEPIAKTEIEYPQEARQEGVEGRLVLAVTIDANGAVTSVSVEKSVQAALDAAAVAAVKQWRFKPSTRCGKPVAGGVYRIARKFELSD
jgi:protein TonB